MGKMFGFFGFGANIHNETNCDRRPKTDSKMSFFGLLSRCDLSNAGETVKSLVDSGIYNPEKI